ncbi:metal ABC transporter ATP-binding protein [Aliiroseovarius sp. PTFE2010]|uniref:metal ABC transporter ATP-binding protein n=1 Tax=Aliiroseovarius sp. PTFE2010 TaxID=3417190 RepID=UPI003CEB6AD6
MNLIEAKDMTLRYSGAPVLEHVDFSIAPGEIVTVIGPNGSGKSTLLKALLGVMAPTGGTITRQPNLRIGYVPQELFIDKRMPLTVARFLSMPHRHTDDAKARALQRVGAEGLESRQMTGLSGGQFQRVLLARALLSAPDILVMDEPTKGLDQPGIAAFYQLIEDLRREIGCAVLLVSHDLHVVMSASDRVICLNGHICCQGAPQVVSNAPEYRALFGTGTGGTLALYQHEHGHSHDPADGCDHGH